MLRDPAELRGAKRRLGAALAAVLLAVAVRAVVDHVRPPTARGNVPWALPVEIRVRPEQSGNVGGLLSELGIRVPDGVSAIRVRILADADACPPDATGLPHVNVSLGALPVATFAVDAPRDQPRAYSSAAIAVTPGTHRLELWFPDDLFVKGSCDRNVRLRGVHVAAL